MKTLEGHAIAQNLLDNLKLRVSDCVTSPGLAAVLVGEDKASKMYLKLKEKAAQEVGINFYDYFLDGNMGQDDIIELVHTLNQDESIDGILVQLPLPEQYEKDKILQAIDPQKDVDGLHFENQNIFFKESANYFLSPFPKAILKLLEVSGGDLQNKKAVVLANSEGFSGCMGKLLEKKGISVECILARSIQDTVENIKKADIIVSALGQSGSITGEMVKEGVIVIDGGIEKVNGAVCGDVDFDSVAKKASTLTPVPGGVGPVTVACLMENVYQAAKGLGKCKTS